MASICQSSEYIQPRLRDVTILMTDMYESTKFAETHGNWAAYEKRQKHNSLLLPLIEGHSGVLVEIVGDSLMAFFDDAEDALQCACAMQECLAEYNQAMTIENQDLEIHIRVGIHCGPVIVHEQLNNIALTGHAVNATARIEAADARRTDQILLSDSVWEQLRDKSNFVIERIGTIYIKGVAGLELHRLLWRENGRKNRSEAHALQNVMHADCIPRNAGRDHLERMLQTTAFSKNESDMDDFIRLGFHEAPRDKDTFESSIDVSNSQSLDILQRLSKKLRSNCEFDGYLSPRIHLAGEAETRMRKKLRLFGNRASPCEKPSERMTIAA